MTKKGNKYLNKTFHEKGNKNRTFTVNSITEDGVLVGDITVVSDSGRKVTTEDQYYEEFFSKNFKELK
ncbi:hypothetical protein PI27_gp039 [Listeria phage WIL-1]|uniref:hypothetical protein n=1 Tax=Listeria phage WIL-1 TaxID=1541821 RepID=UPI00248D076B|nr:hypothetical protein PI27_gp039 [Listeria phage WIL-1]